MTLPRLALVLALLLPAAPALADPPKCTCRSGNACYHYLNAPVEAPDDPCNCPLCRAVRGGCPRRYPKEWDAACLGNKRVECFLRRHAYSWKIACSERLAGTCECRNRRPEWCPCCGSNGRDWGREELSIVERQLSVERPFFGPRKKLVVVKSPHFILVTDIPKMKVRLQKNPKFKRVMRIHEIAHLFVERAEIAYRDFVRHFGDRVILPRPSAIYLVQRESTKEAIAEAYFGLPKPELAYGGDWKRIGGGYPYNACALSFEKYDDDHWLHHMMRHCIGHLLISCWTKVTGKNEFLPRWAYAGAGHWLSRLPENLREKANFCFGEGRIVTHSGEKWPLMLQRLVARGDPHPIQRILDVSALGGLDLEMHQRAWSWFDHCLAEDRERFVAYLAALREGTNHRVALREAMGLTPEEFEQRWRDRILGRRRSMAPTAEELDAVNPEAAGAKERAAIRSETDLEILAGKIRGLVAVNDPLTAETIVPRLRGDSELVRETIVLVLSRTTSAEVKAWLRTDGLQRSQGVVRAQVARVIGEVGDREAGDALLQHWADSHWLVQAHVARALGILLHEPGIPRLVVMLGDSSAKVRVAALDALARFGRRAADSWSRAADHLGAGAWQERCAAAQCLGALGEMRAVGPLVARMKIESGRLRLEIREALKRITRDDLGANPKYWEEWWKKEKERNPDLKPPEEAVPPPPSEHEYGEKPTYYGLRVFSRGIGYVLDTSGSMAYEFKTDPAWLERSGRDYPPVASKFDLAKLEITESLRSLDPRVRLNLWFFRTKVSRWKSGLVPATPQNIENALSRLEPQRPEPPRANPRTGAAPAGMFRTNYVDTFRMILGLKAGAPRPGGFADTPDSIYFLTDGKPTVGEIIDPEIFLRWLEERNRWARIDVNVITFGNVEANLKFLERLAKENGGVFVAVPAAD